VYTNPSTGVFTIKSENHQTSQTWLLIDAMGRELKKLEVRNEYTTLDLSDYPAGMYYLKSGTGMAKRGTLMIKN
jgi:hypothetical protein